MLRPCGCYPILDKVAGIELGEGKDWEKRWSSGGYALLKPPTVTISLLPPGRSGCSALRNHGLSMSSRGQLGKWSALEAPS